jgi:hypothetical protein
MPRAFVVPRGFATAIDEPAQEVRLNRLKPPPNSEVFLIESAHPETFVAHPELPGITLGYRADGALFRAKSGKKFQQFRLCRYCGRAFDHAPKTHMKPWGSECSNKTLTTVDLVLTRRRASANFVVSDSREAAGREHRAQLPMVEVDCHEDHVTGNCSQRLDGMSSAWWNPGEGRIC